MVDFNVASLPDAVSIGVNNVVVQGIAFVPNLLWALIYVLLGYVLASVISHILQKLLDHLKVEAVFKKFKVEDALGGNQVSPILVSLARWYVILLFLQAAVAALQMETLTSFFDQVLLFAPRVVAVALFIIAAALLGEWVREAILDLKKFYLQYTISQVSRVVIILMAVVVGLETVGFQMAFVREIFTLLMQGIVYGVAIAFGLAFGLGGQKDASDLIRRTRRRLNL